MMVYPPDYLWLKLFGATAYLFIGGGFQLIPKPGYLPISLNILALFTVVLYLCLGDEWGSVWCWLASCLCVLYLFEPMLFRRFRVFDAEALEGRRGPGTPFGIGF